MLHGKVGEGEGGLTGGVAGWCGARDDGAAEEVYRVLDGGRGAGGWFAACLNGSEWWCRWGAGAGVSVLVADGRRQTGRRSGAFER